MSVSPAFAIWVVRVTRVRACVRAACENVCLFLRVRGRERHICAHTGLFSRTRRVDIIHRV